MSKTAWFYDLKRKSCRASELFKQLARWQIQPLTFIFNIVFLSLILVIITIFRSEKRLLFIKDIL